MARTIDASGNWVDISDTAPAGPPPVVMTGRNVTLIDDTGNPRVIDEGEYAQARAAGWRDETPEEEASRAEAARYGGFGEQVEGTLEEVARVGSFGASDAIIGGALEAAKGQEFADAERARMAARQRQLSTVGKGIGLAGGIGLTAGLGVGRLGGAAEGLVARGLGGAGLAGEGIAQTALRTGAKLAAGGAVEGAAMGAGAGLSEAALAPGGDYDGLAQKLWAGAKHGAAFGAGAGAFLGVGSGALGAASRRGMKFLTGPAGVKRLLESTADEATTRAVGGLSPTDVAKLGGEDGIATLARQVRSHALDDGSKVFTAGASKERIAEQLAKATDEVGAKLGTLRREVSDAIETAGRADLRPELGTFFKGVDDFVDAAAKGPRALAKRAEAAAAQVEGLRKLWQAGGATLEDVAAYRVQLDKVIKPRAPGGGLRVAKANAEELTKVRDMLESHVAESVERGIAEFMPAQAAAYSPLKLRYKALTSFNQLAERNAGRELARNRFAPFETFSTIGGGLASLATGNVMPLLGGAAIGAARHLYSARGESTIAVLADMLAKSEARTSGALNKFFAAGAAAPRKALAAGAVDDIRASRSRTADALRIREGEVMADAYRKRLREIQDFDPMRMEVGAVAKDAPGTATGLVAARVRARDFLLEKAPRELLGDDPLQPHLKRPVPSRPELEKFARYMRTVDDPLSVLDDLNDGRLSKEQVEALRVVYPAVYADLEKRIVEKLTDSTERVPYLKRVQLGLLLGIPTDKSLQPHRVAMSQAIYAPPGQGPGATAAAPSAPRGRGTNGAIGKSMATSSQANEGGLVEF